MKYIFLCVSCILTVSIYAQSPLCYTQKIKLLNAKRDVSHDTILVFRNYMVSDSSFRVIENNKCEKNEVIEKLICDYEFKGSLQTPVKRRFAVFIEYFKCDKYYYVNLYIYYRREAWLESRYRIFNNKIIAICPSVFLSDEFIPIEEYERNEGVID